MKTDLPETRLSEANQMPLRPDEEWVLYWMTAFRRTRYNFSLQYARDLALELGKPLIVLEALKVRHRWASERFHRFIIDGMLDNRRSFADTSIAYHPYVEEVPGDGAGLVESLAAKACVVVTDDFPCFFHPRMYRLVAKNLNCSLRLVDSNGLMPMRLSDRTFTVAHSYRRYMQKQIAEQLLAMPEPNPLDRRKTNSLPQLKKLPSILSQRWPAAPLDALAEEGGLRKLPIDHSIAKTGAVGGSVAAAKQWDEFLQSRLGAYDQDRNQPQARGSTELSPYLHFGHISAHEVFESLMKQEGWDPSQLGKPNGRMVEFWNVSPSAEALLDQLSTWRELGFNMCVRRADYDRYESLPDWALQTMHDHESDPRPWVYCLAEFEQAQTHDALWNAAQRQLVREGRIHNYLRMLWGKKIYHWSKSPREALRIMIELNNKYALDGRNPNSYSGIFWVLGRYDRAWGPERPIFGKIRYMASENTAKKYPVKEYIHRYSSVR